MEYLAILQTQKVVKYTSIKMSPPVADSTKEDTKATQRRINKPLIEKRRRARINDCLTQLKNIVLEAQESQSPKPSKLEKADILEMTVDFIKKRTASNSNEDCYHGDKNQRMDYMAGYTGCLTEVSRFLTKTNGINQELREKIIHHMTEKVRDSNNNDSPVEDKLSIPENNAPISCDLSKSVIETSEACSAKKSESEAKSEPRYCDKDVFFKGKDIPMVLDFNNIQTSATGLFPGSQVLLVLQLPPAHNTMASNSFTAPFSNFTNTFNSAVPVLQSESTQEAVDLSQPQSKASRNVLNPHPARQTVDDPAAILGSSIKQCDIYTQRMQTIQTLPLDLCTSTRKNEQPPSDDDHWRPW